MPVCIIDGAEAPLNLKNNMDSKLPHIDLTEYCLWPPSISSYQNICTIGSETTIYTTARDIVLNLTAKDEEYLQLAFLL
jgi:hypothetical protein